MADYTRVDVFTDTPGGGNPAGVVTDAAGLDAAEMQRIAAVVGASETAFVTREGRGYRLRWFTPACEVPLCGHATLAAAHALGIQHPTEFAYGGGTLTVRPEVLGGDVLYWLSRPAPELRAFDGDPAPILAALGNPPLDEELPLVVSECDLLVPVRDHLVVEALEPDPEALGAACREAGLIGVAALAVPGPGWYEVRTRFFGPAVGVPEDPATGSVHGIIVVYLHQMQILEHWPEELRALSLQGDPHGRTGVVYLRLKIDPEHDLPLVAEVGGQAVTAGEGSA